tara:strand:- start:597 stop:764 length:168 start_codon:yes stop_codon:yes gene_type:complete
LLYFSFVKEYQKVQKSQNAKSTEEVEQKLDEIAGALATANSRMDDIFSMLMFLSR